MSRKSQIQMTETIVVVFVFIILVVIGIVFWSKYESLTLTEEAEQQKRARSVEQALKVTFLPELECSTSGVTEEGCIDLLKLEKFIDLGLGADPYYFEIFGRSEININYIDVADHGLLATSRYANAPSWLVYDNPKQGEPALVTMIPVSLYDPYENKYYFGQLTIKYY